VERNLFGEEGIGVRSMENEFKLEQFSQIHPTILIIDDESGFRKILREMFCTIGCNVYSAENGKAGLYIYKEYQFFDLVILDMQMPVMEGRITYREIKKLNPKQKFLIISGYVNLEDLDEVIKKGSEGFLKKPFSIYKIIGKVKDIILV
jgi:CheY-like chemotaxis protein